MRWRPSGDKLASASWDNTAKLLDFKTGKVLYTVKTSDKRNYLFQIYDRHSLIRVCNVSLLHLDQHEGAREQELLSRMLAKQHNSDNDSVN